MMMIERVSRAIQDAIPGWLADDGKVEDIDLARAALTALLEPTEAMEKASEKNEGCGCPCCYRADDWTLMIQAALDEKEG